MLLAGFLTLRVDAAHAGVDNPATVYERVLELLAAKKEGMLLVLDPTLQMRLAAIENADPSLISRAAGSSERFERLRTLNEVPVSLASVVRDSERWVVLSEDEQKPLQLGTSKAVQAIRAGYPRVTTLVRMSRAYVDALGDHALIYVEEFGNCDSPCGSVGILISLHRSPNAWVVDSQETLWRGHWRG